MTEDIYDYFKIGFFILIGIGLGFLWWHPSNNTYVSGSDYDILKTQYDGLVVENEQLRVDMADLILEFYTKSFIFDFIGLRKHQRAFCAVQKYITGDIPVLGELIC